MSYEKLVLYIIALFMSSKIKFDVSNSVGCSCKCIVVNQLENSFLYINHWSSFIVHVLIYEHRETMCILYITLCCMNIKPTILSCWVHVISTISLVRNGKHDHGKRQRSCIEDINRKRKKRKERLKSIVKLAHTWKGILKKMSEKH